MARPEMPGCASPWPPPGLSQYRMSLATAGAPAPRPPPAALPPPPPPRGAPAPAAAFTPAAAFAPAPPPVPRDARRAAFSASRSIGGFGLSFGPAGPKNMPAGTVGQFG